MARHRRGDESQGRRIGSYLTMQGPGSLLHPILQPKDQAFRVRKRCRREIDGKTRSVLTMHRTQLSSMLSPILCAWWNQTAQKYRGPN
jgi:hypothetical protein